MNKYRNVGWPYFLFHADASLFQQTAILHNYQLLLKKNTKISLIYQMVWLQIHLAYCN
jgi:hypothetical protein